MRFRNGLVSLGIASMLLSGGAVVGCDNDDSVEDNAERAAERVEDSAERAADNVEDAAEKTADKVKDAAD